MAAREEEIVLSGKTAVIQRWMHFSDVSNTQTFPLQIKARILSSAECPQLPLASAFSATQDLRA